MAHGEGITVVKRSVAPEMVFPSERGVGRLRSTGSRFSWKVVGLSSSLEAAFTLSREGFIRGTKGQHLDQEGRLLLTVKTLSCAAASCRNPPDRAVRTGFVESSVILEEKGDLLAEADIPWKVDYKRPTYERRDAQNGEGKPSP